MGKMHTQAPVTPSDAFAVPLEDGRFSVCRVLRIDESGLAFVANSAWIGSRVPSAQDPALRPLLRLTHHNWSAKLCAAWVSGTPPEDFIHIGSIAPAPDEDSIVDTSLGGWPFFRIQPLEQWYWDHPEDVPPPEPSPNGRFILHRFNGDEVYRLKSAVMSACKTETGVTLWFEVTADPDEAQRCEDTAELRVSPNAEVGIDLPGLNADQLVGRTFSIPGTTSDDEDSCMSLLYYCEHEPLRKNKIAVVSRTADRFWLRWTAVTKDVNYYDGSKPPTRVAIEGEFLFKDIGKWAEGEPDDVDYGGGT